MALRTRLGHPTGTEPPVDQSDKLYKLTQNPEDKVLKIKNGIAEATNSIEIAENYLAFVSFLACYTVLVISDFYTAAKNTYYEIWNRAILRPYPVGATFSQFIARCHQHSNLDVQPNIGDPFDQQPHPR